jgi:hypothetical protein
MHFVTYITTGEEKESQQLLDFNTFLDIYVAQLNK